MVVLDSTEDEPKSLHLGCCTLEKPSAHPG
jgi:hypothetical protein